VRRLAGFVSWLVILGYVEAGCLEVGLMEAGDDEGSLDAGQDAPDSAQEASTVTGSGCALDPVSGVALCQSTSLCPGLAVDQDALPGCGFRIPNTSMELVCVCDDYLCPVGTSLSCAQAKQLLAGQSALAVCTQLSEGRCASRAGSASPAVSSSSCDRSCADSCVGAPACLGLCGC
jgi:hypothetical protein